MKIEPRMAIACRDEVEIKVALQMIEKAGICWPDGGKATKFDIDEEELDRCRLYIYPLGRGIDRVFVVYDRDPDETGSDDDDGFEWTYVEASDIFKNQIISKRRKTCYIEE